MTHFPFRIVLLVVVLAAFTSNAAAVPRVERVSFTERSDGEGYVVRFHVDGAVGAYSEPRKLGGGRVEIILFNTALSPTYQADPAEGPVVSYDEESASGHLIFRFRLGTDRPLDASAYRDRVSNDVLVGLTYAENAYVSRLEIPKQLPIPVRNASTAAAPRQETPSLADGMAAPAPRTSARPTATTPVEGAQWMLDKVVIDAGHGGKDPGALANSVREKDITLGVALKLGRYLEDLLGIEVDYTRQDDRFIELQDRGRIANEDGGKLFISLHVNAAAAAAAQGTETYFLGMHKTAAARTTMERENAVVKLESSQHEYENMTEEALIRMELTQSAYMSKSEDLSELIQEQFETRVQRKNRGVKQAGFYVLWGASMPAVLVEMGFLTNSREAVFLGSEEGQDYMASAIYRAVRAYKEQYEKGLSHAGAP